MLEEEREHGPRTYSTKDSFVKVTVRGLAQAFTVALQFFAEARRHSARGRGRLEGA